MLRIINIDQKELLQCGWFADLTVQEVCAALRNLLIKVNENKVKYVSGEMSLVGKRHYMSICLWLPRVTWEMCLLLEQINKISDHEALYAPFLEPVDSGGCQLWKLNGSLHICWPIPQTPKKQIPQPFDMYCLLLYRILQRLEQRTLHISWKWKAYEISSVWKSQALYHNHK